jgi:hypothetical protein
MERLKFRAAMGLLSAALATACSGGQTGQPQSIVCDTRELSSSSPWSDTTVAAAAAAFVATYDAPLAWQPVVVDFPDRLKLTIFYEGASARRSCEGRLTVPVTVGLSSSDSGIEESGAATLEITASSGGLVADLRYAGQRVALEARLTELAEGARLTGDLEALDEDLPGTSAGFDLEP